MGVERARRAADQVEAIVEADLAPGLDDAGVRGVDRGRVAELARQVLGPVDALGRQRRVELERPPADRERARPVAVGERPQQVGRPEIAPGADDVGDDLEAGHVAAVSLSRRRSSLPLAARGSAASGWKARGHL